VIRGSAAFTASMICFSLSSMVIFTPAPVLV
jgi:hypothetical protein